MTNKIKIIGCGYIGKKVAERLKNKSKNITCFVKSADSKRKCESKGLNVKRFDLDEKGLGLSASILSTFENSRIAYFSPPQPKGEIDLRMQNFIAALDVLSQPPVKIVLISTTGVYGDCQGEWIDESREPKPQVARAYRRLSAETLLKEYCDKNNTPLIIFRVPGIYAADKLPLKRIKSGEPIVNVQDSGFTNRIHADDLSAFCSEALLEDIDAGIYNCCDGEPSTMYDYFTKVADAMQLPRPAEISLHQAEQELSEGMLSYLSESKRISNKKLLEKFNTSFKYANLKEGLKPLNTQ